jgi:hypothetical protein
MMTIADYKIIRYFITLFNKCGLKKKFFYYFVIDVDKNYYRDDDDEDDDDDDVPNSIIDGM